MTSVILCEGKTDAVLISYYLIKVNNWQFKAKPQIKVPISENSNQSASWYTLANNDLLIWGVGGKNNFNNAIRDILEINKLSENAFENIIIVTDRDASEADSDIADSLKNEFCKVNENDSFSLHNREWTSFNYTNSFQTKCTMNTSCLIIPFEKSGALETFLLDSLREDIEKREIIDSCIKFVNGIDSTKYVNTDRLKLKSQLGVTFAIFSPEKVFTQLDLMLKQIPWEQYKTIQFGFSLFDSLIEN